MATKDSTKQTSLESSRVRTAAVARAALALVAVALALLPVGPLASPAHANSFTVNVAGDPVPDASCPASCSLREAVIAANLNPGLDTITAPSGTVFLTRAGAGEDLANTGDLDITGDLTFTGAGANLGFVDGGALGDRVIHVLPGATVTISGATILNGTVGTGGGGGIRNEGTLTLDQVVVRDNVATLQNGGGIFNLGTGTLTVIDSTVSSNVTAVNGGGIATFGSSTTLTVRNSTISGNLADLNGGGIFSNNATTSLNNVTIHNNTADDDAAGGGDGGGVIWVGGTFKVKNSIIAGNTDGSAGAEAPDCGGTLFSQGYNLIQNTTGCTITGTTTGNVTGNPLLVALANNGGRTKTHALGSGSPAIDAGNPAAVGSGGDACEANDQRGEPRSGDGDGVGLPVCDIGAFEVQAENIDPVPDGSQYAYGENVGWINAEPTANGGPGIQVSDTGLKGYMWGENIGWISLSCENTDSCATTSYGVTNDSLGRLAGYAWSENAGWISFSCANTSTCSTASYGVTIGVTTGVFAGNAWGENIGWITFSDNAPFSYQVQTGWRSALADLDKDSDGCTNAAELQTAAGSETTGGRRDPNHFWDFYDVVDAAGNPPPDGIVDLMNDIFALADRFDADDAGGSATINRNSDPLTTAVPAAPAYHPLFDRGQTLVGPDPWDLGPPDGIIDLMNDIFNMAAQFDHNCQ